MELELERVHIPNEEWKKGPAHLNGLIKGLIEKYAAKQEPTGGKLRENPTTGLIARVPETISAQDRYDTACLKVRETIAEIRSDGLGNHLVALDPIMEKLETALAQHGGNIGFMRDRFGRAFRRIHELIHVGELDRREGVVNDLLDDLSDGMADAETASPEVSDTIQKRRDVKAVTPSDELAGRIIEVAPIIADAAEPDVAEDVLDGAEALARQQAALGENAPIPDNSDRDLIINIAWMYFRIPRLKRPLKEDAEKGLKVADAIGKLDKAQEALGPVFGPALMWLVRLITG